MGPLRDECATEGFYLCAEDSSGHVGQSAGPIFPLSKIEGAQRVAINNAALGDITSLLDGPHKDSDVCFVVEGRQLHAHKCILSARCEAFRGMFNSPMREGSKGPLQVEMPEVSFAAFECMLRFIYGGARPIPDELAVEVLGLADQYLMDGLKQMCGFTLARMVSVDSVSRIIQAADRWDAPTSQLKQRCLDFILSNYKTVVMSPVFQELESSPHLLLEISRAAATIVNKPQAGSPWPGSFDSTPASKRQRLSR